MIRLLAGCLALLLACAGGAGREANPWEELATDADQQGPTIHIGGLVRHLDLEGGLFVIEDADGPRYYPINLPPTFQLDGLPVEAEARPRDDLASIGMVGPLVELVRIRKAGTGTPSGAPWLTGSTWRLENLAGAGVLDSVEATLEFPSEGRAAGNASCNRFTGPVTVAGAAITFGPLALTRMACPEAVMRQESAYLEALRGAQRFRVEGPFLYIFSAGREKPLRFIRG
jgi:heat shock protein HslJ